MSGLFGPTNGRGFVPFNFSVLGDYFNAKAQLRATTATHLVGTQTTNRTSKAVTTSVAPWDNVPKGQTDIAKLREALTTTSFVNVNDADFNKLGVPADQKKLFALYQGLAQLQTLASHAADKGTSEVELAGLSRRFEA